MGGAELQKVVFLRDAGRDAEALAVMEARNERIGADDKDSAEAEDAVEKSLAELREERRKQTGRTTCP